MNILRQSKNRLRGLLHRHGTEAMSRWIWNKEFTSGHWACLDSMLDDCVLSFVNTYAKGGSILDVGCGPGAVGEAINPNAYCHYTGVDISNVAIDNARKINSRSKNLYVVGDMRSFKPSGTYNLVLFGDSLYYCSFSAAKQILRCYSSCLSESGVFVMRCWVLRARTRAIVNLIESDYDVIETHWPVPPHPIIVIVFKPRNRVIPPARSN